MKCFSYPQTRATDGSSSTTEDPAAPRELELPPELWDTILSFLQNNQKVVLKCSAVCRTWRSSCKSLFNELRIFEYRDADSDSDPSADGTPPYSQTGFDLLKGNPESILRHPRRVSIRGGPVGYSGSQTDSRFASYAFQLLPYLEPGRIVSLTLRNIEFTQMTHVLSGLEGLLPTLTHLSLDEITFATRKDFDALVRAVPLLDHLELNSIGWEPPKTSSHPKENLFDKLPQYRLTNTLRRLTLGCAWNRQPSAVLKVFDPYWCDISTIEHLEIVFPTHSQTLFQFLNRMGPSLLSLTLEMGRISHPQTLTASATHLHTLVVRAFGCTLLSWLPMFLLGLTCSDTLRHLTISFHRGDEAHANWDEVDEILSSTTTFSLLQTVTSSVQLRPEPGPEMDLEEGTLRAQLETNLPLLQSQGKLRITYT